MNSWFSQELRYSFTHFMKPKYVYFKTSYISDLYEQIKLTGKGVTAYNFSFRFLFTTKK